MMIDTTKNRAIAEQVFDYLISIGYQPYDVTYGDGYFIFSLGEDSVVHFRLKGVSKHWLFGMWINAKALDMDEGQQYKERNLHGISLEDRAKVVELFAQWDTRIDKFKPSRSDLLVNISAVRWIDHIITDFDPGAAFWEINHMLGSMRRHPLLCYANVLGAGGYQHYFDESFLWYFLKYEGKKKLVLIRQRLMWLLLVPYTYLKCAIAEKSFIIDSIRIVDFEKEYGLSTTYEYEVWITFSQDAKDDDMSKWLSFWFRRQRYGRFDTYDYMVEVQPLRQVGCREMFSFHTREER